MVSLLFEILGFPNIYISARAHSPAAKWFINFCSKRVPTIHWQPLRFLIVFLSNGKLAKHRKIGQPQQLTRFIAMHMQIHKYTNTQIHKYANTQRQRQHRRVGHQQQVTGFMWRNSRITSHSIPALSRVGRHYHRDSRGIIWHERRSVESIVQRVHGCIRHIALSYVHKYTKYANTQIQIHKHTNTRAHVGAGFPHCPTCPRLHKARHAQRSRAALCCHTT